jgi:hypothetical protein
MIVTLVLVLTLTLMIVTLLLTLTLMIVTLVLVLALMIVTLVLVLALMIVTLVLTLTLMIVTLVLTLTLMIVTLVRTLTLMIVTLVRTLTLMIVTLVLTLTSMEENVRHVLKALHLEERLDKAEALLEKMLLLVESAERRVAAGAAIPEPFVGPGHYSSLASTDAKRHLASAGPGQRLPRWRFDDFTCDLSTLLAARLEPVNAD